MDNERLRHTPKQHGNKGFTLIEALIALLVLAFGLLGVAAMQLKAMQSAHVSYQRSIATLAAQDAVERLWTVLGEVEGTCPSAESIEEDWYAQWDQFFPGLKDEGITLRDGCEFVIKVDWVDERFGDEDVSTLVYVTRLPGGSI